jgi:hypothetical protein
VKNRFPFPTSVKQLEDVLLGTIQNLYESIARRTAAVLKAKVGPTPY